MSSELPGLLSSFISTPEANSFNSISIVSKEGLVHKVSKIIMAAHSSVLYSIFTHESDKSKTTFHLPTTDGKTLALIFAWMESGELPLTWTNIFEVLETAEFLDIPLASSHCQEWMVTRMTTNKALRIWRFARNHFLQDLEKTSLAFIAPRFTEIYKDVEFYELPAETLRMLLTSDQLSCGEEEVWEGLMVWVGKDTRDVVEVAKMMETIRFCLIQPDFLQQRVHPKVEEVLSKVDFNFPGPFPAKPRCPQSLLFVFGGWSGTGPVSTISVFDPAAAMWTDLSISLPYNWAYMATVVVGTDIFLCGGHMDEEGDWAARILMKFCPDSMEVSRLSMMRERRNYLSLAVHAGNIYAIGGNNHNTRLKSVEMFDISRNQWSMVRDMNRVRSDAGAATLQGSIYVVGGFDGVAATSTAEVFSPRSGRWTMITPMKVARSGVKVVAMDSQLYVVGGWDGRQRLRSGEVYSPVTKQWTSLPDMNTPRSNHSMAVVQGMLVVMGGYNGTEPTRRVEALDMISNTWKEVGELSTKRSALACGVVNFNSLEEKVRDGLRYQKEEEVEEMDAVEWDIFSEEADSASSCTSGIINITDDSDEEYMVVE